MAQVHAAVDKVHTAVGTGVFTAITIAHTSGQVEALVRLGWAVVTSLPGGCWLMGC